MNDYSHWQKILYLQMKPNVHMAVTVAACVSSAWALRCSRWLTSPASHSRVRVLPSHQYILEKAAYPGILAEVLPGFLSKQAKIMSRTINLKSYWHHVIVRGTMWQWWSCSEVDWHNDFSPENANLSNSVLSNNNFNEFKTPFKIPRNCSNILLHLFS